MAKKPDESWNPTTQPDPGGQMGGASPGGAPGVPPKTEPAGTDPAASGGNGDDGGKNGDSPTYVVTPSSPPSAPKYDENTKLDIPETETPDPARRAELNPTVEEKTIDRVAHYDKQPMIDMTKEQVELARRQ